jgi:hypothetical protein
MSDFEKRLAEARLREPVLFLAGPYRDPRGPHFIRENIERARAAAVHYWQRGFTVFTPHLNSYLMDGAAPDEAFIRGALEILRRCDIVVMLPGWQRSAGALAEHALAQELGMEVWVHEEASQ